MAQREPGQGRLSVLVSMLVGLYEPAVIVPLSGAGRSRRIVKRDCDSIEGVTATAIAQQHHLLAARPTNKTSTSSGQEMTVTLQCSRDF